MRFLQTGDWHLGRYLHGASLIEDQAHVLDQFVDLARRAEVDAVVIAGDIYDRSLPPAEAVALLDDVLARLVVGVGIPVIVIAGNHDSPERIGFGGRILGRQGLHVRGSLGDLAPIVITDAHGPVAFHPLPYADPVFARAVPGGAEIADHRGAMTHLVSTMRARFRDNTRNVLIGHAFVAGGDESDSERPLSVGGTGAVSAATFEGFDSVALGHLHRPQSMNSGRIHYAGSLLKYSFSEVDHTKGVSLVELRADGTPVIESLPLNPRRDVRIVTGTLAELLDKPLTARQREDYLCAHLTDPGPVLEPMARLREVYPNMLELRFVREPIGNASAQASGDHRRRRPGDLFRAFYRDVVGEEIADDGLAVFNESLRAVSVESDEDAR